jgi:hypothetical protein
MGHEVLDEDDPFALDLDPEALNRGLEVELALLDELEEHNGGERLRERGQVVDRVRAPFSTSARPKPRDHKESPWTTTADIPGMP